MEMKNPVKMETLINSNSNHPSSKPKSISSTTKSLANSNCFDSQVFDQKISCSSSSTTTTSSSATTGFMELLGMQDMIHHINPSLFDMIMMNSYGGSTFTEDFPTTMDPLAPDPTPPPPTSSSIIVNPELSEILNTTTNSNNINIPTTPNSSSISSASNDEHQQEVDEDDDEEQKAKKM